MMVIELRRREQEGPYGDQFGFNMIVPNEEVSTRVIIKTINYDFFSCLPQDLFNKKYLILCPNLTRQKSLIKELTQLNDQRFVKFPKIKIWKQAKNQKSLNMRDQIEKNNVFVLIHDQAYSHILHDNFQLEDFDYVIFDQINLINSSDHPYNLLMTKFMLNIEKAKRRPLIMGLINMNFSKDFKDNKDFMKLKMLSNCFNSKLLIHKIQDIKQIQAKQAYSLLQNAIHLKNLEKHQCLRLFNNLRDDLDLMMTLSSPNYLKFTQPDKQIVDVKRKSINQRFINFSIKTTVLFQDAERIIHQMNETLTLITKGSEIGQELYLQKGKTPKLAIETIQFNQNKQRYFSSRIQLDPLVMAAVMNLLNQYFSLDPKTDYLSFNTEHLVFTSPSSSSLLQLPCPLPHPTSSHIFMKKLDSEMFTMLELVKLMHRLGLLNDQMLPNIEAIKQALGMQAQDEDEGFRVEERKEEETAGEFFYQEIATQDYQGLDYNQILEEETIAEEFEISLLNQSISNYISQKNSYENNFEKILLFFENYVKIVLLAVDLANESQQTDKIQWTDKMFSPVREFEASYGLYAQYLKDKEAHKKNIIYEQTRLQHENLKIFAKKTLSSMLFDDQIEQFYRQFQVQLSCTNVLQNLHLPEMIQDIYTDFQLYNQAINENKDWKVNIVLVMACIGLAFQKPSTQFYEIAKYEMERLTFVGDSAINLCITLDQVLSGKDNAREQDLSQSKALILKEENLLVVVENSGLRHILLSIDETDSTTSMTIEASSVKNSNFHHEEDNRRSLNYLQQIQRVAGFITICFGIEAAYLFLKHIQVLKIQTNDRQTDKICQITGKRCQDYSLLSDHMFSSCVHSLSSSLSLLSHHRLRMLSLHNQQAHDTLTSIVQKYINLADQSEMGVLRSKDSAIGFREGKFNRLKQMLEQAAAQITVDKNEEEKSAATSTGAYKIHQDHIILQALTHKSFAKKIMNSKMPDMFSQKELKIVQLFNYELLEYLGDAFLNFSLVKRLYLDTWHYSPYFKYEYYPSKKLHEIKSWFSSNHFIAFALYEQFYRCLGFQERKDYAKKLSEIKSQKLTDKNDAQILKSAQKLPMLYNDEHLEHKDLIDGYNSLVFQQCAPEFESQQDLSINKNFSLHNYTQTTLQQENEKVTFDDLKKQLVKFFSDIFEALLAAVFIDSGNFDLAQTITLRLLNSQFVTSIPSSEHYRTKVLNICNSKWYAKPFRIHHFTEIRDQHIYFKCCIKNIEVRRVKLKHDHKQKVNATYQDLFEYLENAFFIFEQSLYTEKLSQKEVEEKWIKFNNAYRIEYTKQKIKPIDETLKLASSTPIWVMIGKILASYKTQQESGFEQISSFNDFETLEILTSSTIKKNLNDKVIFPQNKEHDFMGFDEARFSEHEAKDSLISGSIFGTKTVNADDFDSISCQGPNIMKIMRDFSSSDPRRDIQFAFSQVLQSSKKKGQYQAFLKYPAGCLAFLEAERVRYTFLREMMLDCDIKFIGRKPTQFFKPSKKFHSSVQEAVWYLEQFLRSIHDSKVQRLFESLKNMRHDDYVESR